MEFPGRGGARTSGPESRSLSRPARGWRGPSWAGGRGSHPGTRRAPRRLRPRKPGRSPLLPTLTAFRGAALFGQSRLTKPAPALRRGIWPQTPFRRHPQPQTAPRAQSPSSPASAHRVSDARAKSRLSGHVTRWRHDAARNVRATRKSGSGRAAAAAAFYGQSQSLFIYLRVYPALLFWAFRVAGRAAGRDRASRVYSPTSSPSLRYIYVWVPPRTGPGVFEKSLF